MHYPGNSKTEGLPIGVIGLASGLFRDGVLEDLAAVYLLLYTATRDQPVDDHVFLLTYTERAVYSLGVRSRVPAGINWNEKYKFKRESHTYLYFSFWDEMPSRLPGRLGWD